MTGVEATPTNEFPIHSALPHHSATYMLLQNEYVVDFSIDFTKTFDRVKHHALSQKLLLLDMTDQIYNWMVDYFKDRGHTTYATGVSFMITWINASIIQGSVVGPPSYVVAA